MTIAEIGDIDSDGMQDVAVGALLSNDGISQGGAMHILRMNGDDTVKAIRKLSQATGFGLDVLSPPVTQLGHGAAAMAPRLPGNPVDLVIGAVGSDAAVYVRLDSTGGVIEGSVRVLRDGQEGIPTGTIQASSRFGFNVVNIGDVNHDGTEDLAISATTDDTGGTNTGKSFIFLTGCADPVGNATFVESVITLSTSTPGLGN